jgi:hypothetical protein
MWALYYKGEDFFHFLTSFEISFEVVQRTMLPFELQDEILQSSLQL